MRRLVQIKLFWSSLVLSLFLAQPCHAAKVLYQQQGAGISIAASTTRYFHLATNNRINDDQPTETNAQITYRSAGTFSNLYINILTNDRGTSTFRTRKNVGNGNMVVSITGTGKFEDIVNTDAVTAADEWNYSMVTGAGGTVFTFKITSVIFDATTNTVSRTGCDSNGSINTASSTLVGALAGDGPQTLTVDSTAGVVYRTAGTLNNFFVNVTVNPRTTTTEFRSRKNSANGNLVVTYLTGQTGIKEDLVNSDSIVIGDLINSAIVTGTGTESLSYGGILADFTTTNSQAMYTAAATQTVQTILAGVTTYYPFAGALRTDTTESNMVAEANLAFIGSLMQVNVSANTITATSTLTFRVNSGAGASQVVSIGNSQTGVIQDVVNSDYIIPSDTLDYLIVTGGTGTSLVLRSISMLGDSTVITRIFGATLYGATIY